MPAATDAISSFFARRGWKPFAFQKETWKSHLAGKSGLLHAPTGQGKTLAVFLGPLAASIAGPNECTVLWITPLRALAADTLRALREPLEELAPHLQAEARTGDTSSAQRAKLRKKLPHTLVTTPESLSLMLTHADFTVSIRFANGHTLGTVEESFVSKLKPGSTLVFAGRHLILVRLHQRTATVKPAPKSTKGHVAIWGGSKMPLSSELAHAVALRLRGQGKPCAEMKAVEPILRIQREWSRLPDDESLLIEHTRSREGEHLFVYPIAGRLVHEGLAALMAFRISRVCGELIQTTQNDYGFSLTAKRGLLLGEEEIRNALAEDRLLDDLIECMNTAELARRQFREIARVSGLILNQPPGRPSRSQREIQSSASLLFEVLQRYDPANLLLQQSRREILERQLELTRLTAAIRSLAGRPLVLIETERLSPMAFPLWADRLSATLPAGDAATRLEAMLHQLNLAAG